MSDKCESGNNLTEDGSGLCTRDATESVEMTASRKGKKTVRVFAMCRFCAGSWSVKHPRTVRILPKV